MKKIYTLFMLAASTSMLYANCGNENCECGDDCACPQVESHDEQHAETSKQYQESVETPDQKLAHAIKNSLYGTASDSYNSVNVKVNNGEVTLSGVVDSQADKEDLGKKVSAMPGVQKVDNQVRVRN